ncbi:MAG TPA: tetratricopeptide repeat protein [Bryobacteraceae bacterium]|nr:tetratricopeptide repeat protein [Bryobacteraceae bacterium]
MVTSIALLLSACHRETAPAVDRLAVLPLDNLGSDDSLNWASSAMGAAVVYDLTGAGTIYAQTLSSAAQAPSMQASRALEGYFFERNGRLEIHASLEDLGTSKTVKSLSFSGPASQGFLPLANQLARALSAEARPFSTANPEAFRLWGQALAANDRQKLIEGMTAATQTDPRFAAAGVDLAEVLIANGDRDRARQVIASAEGAHPGLLDQAQLAYVSASLAGDANLRFQALSTLAQRSQANASLFAELARLQVIRRDFAGAARNYRDAGRLNPSDPDIWNQLGYALAYGQDLAGARRAIEQYQRLDPEGFNPLDSLGEVSFYLGDFEGASKYFLEAAKRNPPELVKAAESRLMTGDLERADAIMDQYLRQAQGPQRARAAYEQAQWEYLTGRHKGGVLRMQAMLPRLEGDLASLALSQLSVWKLEEGDGKSAADLADQAAARAMTPQARNLSALCRLISLGSETSSGSRVADAYVRLFARKYQEAVPLLEAVYRDTSPSADGQIRTLLAWAYVETGRTADAAKLLTRYPIPLSSGEAQFASLIFPRYLFLRGEVLEKEGKHDEARKADALYLKYSGDIPDVFGDEAKARKNLGATY